jgi:hypothetical protein
MVVFSPWAFGTTQEWAIWTMTVAGCVLGGLLAAKWLIRWRTGYEPSRWGSGKPRWLVVCLAVLTVLIVGWCLLSAVNARATFYQNELRFDYHDHYIAWLPHSYDAPSTWFAFWQYLGLAWAFWAVRDWLLGKTRHERHAEWAEQEAEGGEAPRPLREHGGETRGRLLPRLPARLRRLLWVLCLNGALLAAEGIFQRMDGTSKLLWLVEPRINKKPGLQFGPYAYRSNGAQYLNLLWPVCLGFWWTLREEARWTVRVRARMGGSPHLVILLCAVVMPAAPVVAASRGGVAVAGACFVGALVILLLAMWQEGWRASGTLLVASACIVGLAGLLGWRYLQARFAGRTRPHPTNLGAEVADLTLYWVMRVPEKPSGTLPTLVALSASLAAFEGTPGSMDAYVDDNGALCIRFFGDNRASRATLTLSQFVQTYAGQIVEVAAVKSDALRVYINGRPVPGQAMTTPSPVAWTNTVAASVFWSCAPALVWRKPADLVAAAALFDRALTPTEIEAMTGNGAVTRARNDAFGKDAPELAQWKPVVEIDSTALSLRQQFEEGLRGRTPIFEDARQMAKDHAWLGSGPGTFGALYYLYRSEPQKEWHATAHDDWLETRITFGAVGFALVLLALVLVLLRWWLPGGMATHWILPSLCCLAMIGCLAHAKFDFPFQIHSILFVFLLLGCVRLCLSRKGETGRSVGSG